MKRSSSPDLSISSGTSTETLTQQLIDASAVESNDEGKEKNDETCFINNYPTTSLVDAGKSSRKKLVKGASAERKKGAPIFVGFAEVDALESPLSPSELPLNDVYHDVEASGEHLYSEEEEDDYEDESYSEEEYITMKTLSKIISPKALQDVKEGLANVKPRLSPIYKGRVIAEHKVHLSPSEEWEKKQSSKHQKHLPKQASSQIKAGWKVRKMLSEIERSKKMTVDRFYLDTVASGCVRDVQALFTCCKIDPNLQLNVNCVNQHEQGALRLAIENNDTPMCEVLLKNKVSIKDNLFHAIERNFIPGVEAILKHDSCIDACIEKDDHYFNVGTTPMILASCNNNYDVIKLLYNYKHRLKESLKWWDGIHLAWESASERIMMCKAKASPAYITFICEVDDADPMEYCLKLIKKLRDNADLEHEFSESYKELENRLEVYMCSLLDEIQSSDELADLFQYNFIYYPDAKSAYDALGNGVESRKKASSRMDLLDLASEKKLVKFVTHHNSQLALSYIRYRCAPFLRGNSSFKRNLIHWSMGLMFPILSLLYLMAPRSRLGALITLPNVSYECHMISDFVFIALLTANVALKSEESDYLGSPPTALEWLIVLWVIGKWIQELRECQNRGTRNYLKDWWNYNDMIQLILFASAITFRALDYMEHKSDGRNYNRSQWTSYEPRLISSGLLAWAYVFVFMRLLSLTRTSRVLGPLQISLAKMLVNVVQFLGIFGLMMFAFALGLTELYWYYGTPEGTAMLCNKTATSSTEDCHSTIFSGLGLSLGDLFWALFGYIDLSHFSLHGKHPCIDWVGHTLVATYHVVAIIILLNMLIAMMAKSFEVTSENEEVEWKFHRTVVWLRYIRREFTRPPPMNLIPNPYSVYKRINKLVSSQRRQQNERSRGMLSSTDHSNRHRDTESGSVKIRREMKKRKSLGVLHKLMQRYKFKKLLGSCSGFSNKGQREYNQK